MRKGLFWAVALVLTGNAVAQAQPGASPSTTTLPDTIANTTKPVDLSRATLGNPVLTECVACSTQRPLAAWVNAEYLLWWVKSGPVNTPLVTTGSLADVPPGALGQPGTRILYGDRPIGYGALNGVRLSAGVALNDGLNLEGNYFLLGKGASHFRAASDANGNPFIARPFFNNQFGVPDAFGTSDPDPAVGPWAGSTSVTSYTQLQGWELNLSTNRRELSNGWSASGLFGFRSLNLNEDLIIQDTLIPLAPGVLNFGFLPANPGSIIGDIDRFHTSNTFYGGQVGGRLDWQQGNFGVGLLGKIALGATQQIAIIDGRSTLMTPGAPTATLPGGILALPSNMGRYYRSTFSVVPEFGLNLGWNITPNIRATAGYTFMYWSHVARPGNQIDSNVNTGLVPTSQFFGNGLGTNRPAFTFHESDFWAQGITLGMEFKF